MITLGRYHTIGGIIAVLAQLRAAGADRWVFIGALEFDNVMIPHQWALDGKSLSGDAKYNLKGKL